MSESWKYKEDPHFLIPVGFESKCNGYKVIGFSGPAGKDLVCLMCTIEYESGSQTTRDYVNVLKDFFNESSSDEIREAWKNGRGKHFEMLEGIKN